MQVPFVDAEDAEDYGYFWRTAGATRFTDGGAPAPGYGSTVAVADRFGVVLFSDLQGEAARSFLWPSCRNCEHDDLGNLQRLQTCLLLV